MQIRTESITTSSVLQSQTTPQPPSAHSQPRYELVIGDFFAPAPTLFDPLHALSTNQFDDDIASFPRDSASRMLPSSSLPVPGSACDDCGKMPSAEIDVDVECRRGLPPLLTFNFHFLKSGLSFSEERLRMQLFRMDRRVSNHPWATKGHTSLSLKSIVQEIMEDEARLRHIPLRLSRAPEEMDLWTVKLKVSPKYKYGVEVVACGRSS